MAFTFFFRDEQILELAAENLAKYASGRSKVRILNAGCAMGPETYTFAILLAEKIGKFALRNTEITAIDIDNENVDFGKTVREGIYHYDLLKRIPENLFKKYFSPAQKASHYIVSSDLRNLVHFKKFNLLTLEPLRTDYSLIICKNVLLHFNYRQRVEVIRYFHSMMLPGAFLAMENTQQMPAELSGKFKKVVSHAQLHQKIN